MSNPFRALASRISEANRSQERWLTSRGQTGYELAGYDTIGYRLSAAACTPVWEPEVNVSELVEGEISLSVGLPGVKGEEVDVAIIAQSVLTISGISPRGPFKRSMALPGTLDQDTVTARLDDGVLQVTGREEVSGYPLRIPVEPADE